MCVKYRRIQEIDIYFNSIINGLANCPKSVFMAYMSHAVVLQSDCLYDVCEENNYGRQEGECGTCSARACGGKPGVGDLLVDGLHPVGSKVLNHRTAVETGEERERAHYQQ